jgi:NAD(P)-dependent dehydrogenase (short-subunit alcohol dehydrogenase family)
MKGSAQCAAFASAKFALRALAQSIAREFGPQGIHVSHAIIDGVIDIPRTKAWTFEHEDAKLDPDAVSLAALFQEIEIKTDGFLSRLLIRTGTCILSRGRLLPLS